MIDKQLLQATVEKAIEGTDMFIVSIEVEAGDRIVVEVDSMSRVDIDECAAITRAIEAVFDRDVEDYELEVGSAGITSPFKVKQQYVKNLGNEVEALTADGRKVKGILAEAGDDTFTVNVPTKVRLEGKKKPEIVDKPVVIPYADARRVAYVIKF